MTRLVFTDFLTLADRHGVVDMTLHAISRRTNVPIDIVTRSVAKLMDPDPLSRSKANEGRRLSPIDEGRDWGWRIINYEAYSSLRNENERSQYMRGYMRDRRAADRSQSQVQSQPNQQQYSQPHPQLNLQPQLPLNSQPHLKSQSQVQQNKESVNTVNNVNNAVNTVNTLLAPIDVPVTTTTTTTTKQKPKQATAPQAAFVLPDWISADAWNSYLEMRKKKRAMATHHAMNLVVRELEKLRSQGHDPNAVLEQSVRNSWTDVYALKNLRQPSQGFVPGASRYAQPGGAN